MKAVELQWHKEQYFGTVLLLLEKNCKTANDFKWVIVQGVSIYQYLIVNSKEHSNTKKKTISFSPIFQSTMVSRNIPIFFVYLACLLTFFVNGELHA